MISKRGDNFGKKISSYVETGLPDNIKEEVTKHFIQIETLKEEIGMDAYSVAEKIEKELKRKKKEKIKKERFTLLDGPLYN